MIIGVPREIMAEEGRVALLPKEVEELTKRGYKVLVQSGAGAGAMIEDRAYLNVGAEIVTDVRELFQKSRVILKVKEPMVNDQLGEHEISLMQEGAVLITFIHPAAPGNHDMVRKLRDRGITSFSMDAIPRIARAQPMDALSSMSTIAGYKAVLVAANRLPKFVPMVGTAVGMVNPAKFLVIGAGVVGLQSIATAKRLGGVVSSVDIRAAAREAGRSLGATDTGWDVPKEIAEGEGGYAKALSQDWLKKEQQFLSALAKDVDVVILSALVPAERAPILITADAVSSMKPGSVIVDVSVDQGGNCELTEGGKEITLANGVVINGFKNLPGRMPVHSSMLYSKNIYNFFVNLYKGNSEKFDLDDEINKEAMVTYGGKIVHKGTLKAMEEMKAK
ncbi:MAG: NAD(P) transhydrogenase subunit alpha [Deltaproteobacteria bacterium]|nr:NAD(P) transhydrogenase subunit alpha [Deltaproteobacteria bacterium]